MDKIKLGVEKNLDNTEMKGGNTQWAF
jgi:hypothetical protein